MRLKGYSDIGHKKDKDERKSTFRYAFMLCGKAISWCRMKQNSMIISVMEY